MKDNAECVCSLHRVSSGALLGFDSIEIPDSGDWQFWQQRIPVEGKTIQLRLVGGMQVEFAAVDTNESGKS